MLINPIKIQREQFIDPSNDPDFRFKQSIRLDSQQLMQRPAKQMRFASNVAERIQEAIGKNQYLNTDPGEYGNQTQDGGLNLRPFDRTKVIDPNQPGFKYKPNTSIERVFDTLQNSRNTSVLLNKRFMSNQSSKISLSRNKNNRTIDITQAGALSPRDLHSGLHQKTHFKAVYEMFVNPVNGGGTTNDETLKRAIRVAPLLEQTMQKSNQVHNNASENWIMDLNHQNSMMNQSQSDSLNANEKELAKKLLRNCNYIRSQKRNISLEKQTQKTQNISLLNQRQQEILKDIAKYKNSRVSINQTMIIDTSKSKLDPIDYMESGYLDQIAHNGQTRSRLSVSASPAARALQFIKTPVRMIHQRGYNEHFDNYSAIFHECNFALMGAKETDQIAYIFRKFEKSMTDFQIAYGFWFIGMNALERNPEFWNEIVPLVKKQLATLDRNCTKSLFHFIEGASAMSLQDNEFWELVEQKLVDERLHRYFELEKLCDILVCLANVGRGSDELIEIIEKTLIKHRKAITPEIAATARHGFQLINKGSEILYKVLEDPTVELPALEA